MSDHRIRVEAILREAQFMTKHPKTGMPVSGLPMDYAFDPKFARKLLEGPQNDRSYTTRSGLLNPTQRKPSTGGNVYCSILRQKKQASALISLQSSVLKDSELLSEPPSPLRPRTAASPLSKSLSCSLFNSRKNSPVASPGKTFVLPKVFSAVAIMCECEVGTPCSCGKRVLSAHEPEEWMAEIFRKCGAVSRATQLSKEQLHSEMKYMKERYQVCARQTSIAMKAQKRAEQFRVRQRMHEVSRRLKTFLTD